MKHLLFLIVCIATVQPAFSQAVSINVDSAAAHPSAILDITSRTKGVLFPRMSEYDRLAVVDPAEGLMVWDTTHNGIWGFDGTQWRELSSKWERNLTHIHNINQDNVGIGISNPYYKLTVNGPLGIYQGDRFIGRVYGHGNDMVINATLGNLLNESSPENLLIQYDFNDILTTSGNVGIGVGSPTAKLHVATNMMIGEGEPALGYALSVNGKIMATEMRIEAQGSWPDYVFTNDYPLRSLDDLSRHIGTLGHLPGIPSALEIQNTGIMIGEMQKDQMEKIEELTLYILQLHHRISSLENDLRELRCGLESPLQQD